MTTLDVQLCCNRFECLIKLGHVLPAGMLECSNTAGEEGMMDVTRHMTYFTKGRQ